MKMHVSTCLSRLEQINRVKHAFDNKILLTIFSSAIVFLYCGKKAFLARNNVLFIDKTIHDSYSYFIIFIANEQAERRQSALEACT